MNSEILYERIHFFLFIMSQIFKFLLYLNFLILVFGILIVVAFQKFFKKKMHQNNIFLKNLFLTSAHKNNSKT
jgi:positive regulator of sigma E activity